MTFSNEVERILSGKGHFLDNDGINNWALSKVHAIEALKELEMLKVPILGGDVVIKKENHFEHNYDNWYFNMKNITEEQIAESYLKARSFIIDYPFTENVFFVIVTG